MILKIKKFNKLKVGCLYQKLSTVRNIINQNRLTVIPYKNN